MTDNPIQINKGYDTRKLQKKKKKTIRVDFTLNCTGTKSMEYETMTANMVKQQIPKILLTQEHNNGSPFDKLTPC